MNIAKQIAEELKIKVWQVEAVMELIDEGCTIPFIARYRKEKHGCSGRRRIIKSIRN